MQLCGSSGPSLRSRMVFHIELPVRPCESETDHMCLSHLSPIELLGLNVPACVPLARE